ncbi:MAG: hypothetical protein ACUVSY_00650 [Roseiflexus sp.]
MVNTIRLQSVVSAAGAFIGLLGALALLWVVRREPLTLPPLAYFDALGAFFALATWSGALLWLLLRKPSPTRRFWLTALLLTVAFLTSLTPLVIAAYALVGLLTALPSRRTVVTRRAVAYPLLAVAALAVGYGTLAMRGGLRYDTPLTGAALDSFVFWFVLLAAMLQVLPFDPLPTDTGDAREQLLRLFAFAWLYPLTRLYTLSPWNEGWSFATLIVGGGTLLWLSSGALTGDTRRIRFERNQRRLLAMALTGIGLSSGAGLAAGCYAVLVYLLLTIVNDDTLTPLAHSSLPAPGILPSAPAWLISGAIPLTAPFIATWMLVGAGAAGGVTVLAAIAWFTALIGALPVVIDPPSVASRRLWIGGGISLALGVASPLVVRLLIQPIIEQLQGGLSVYGDVNVWTWMGLAMVNSARTGITALPTIGVAGLMLVLSALVYLLGRLLRTTLPATPVSADSPSYDDVVRYLRRAVPWLGEPAAKASDHDNR